VRAESRALEAPTVLHVGRSQLGPEGSQHAGDDEQQQTDDTHDDDARQVVRRRVEELEEREHGDEASAEEAQYHAGVSDDTEEAVSVQFDLDPHRELRDNVSLLNAEFEGGHFAELRWKARCHFMSFDQAGRF
jgi:hypothetical protein